MPSPSRPRGLRALAALGASLLAGLASAGPAAAQGPETRSARLTFVLTNDLYDMSEKNGRGGLARLAAVVKAEKAKGTPAFFVHAGDAWSPCLLCGFDKGAHMVALLNEIPPDVFVPGNHEFDFGPAEYMKRRAEARFPFFAANMRGSDGQPLPGHQDRTMLDVNGVKVGVVGLALESTPLVSSPGDVRFTSAMDALKAQAKALRDEGADLVVAVAHTSRATDYAIHAERIVDVLLTGHDHDLRLVYDGRAAMMESGEDAEYVAVMDLDVTVKREGDRRQAAWRPSFRIVDTASVTPDPVVAARVEAFEGELSRELDVPLGQTSVELDTRTATVRSREAAFGSLVADALRASTGAEVAITNGGGLRGNRTYPAGSTLTRRDVFTEMPFGNVTAMTELAGADIRAALEHGLAQAPGVAGRFPHVSGMRVEADLSKPAGARVVSVTVGDAPLDEGRTYRVATNSFLLRGGDGYAPLTRGRVLIGGTDGKPLAGEVMSYIRAQGTLPAPTAGRLVLR
jgi:2',3'-cyclic-nucleotide 2'-phosphodiesterase (5'-nucleotidase family)